jgi:Flp pilus assembly protein TadG
MTSTGVGNTDTEFDELVAPRRGRRFRGDRGNAIVSIVVLPTLLITMMLVVQFALALHARQVMAGAAQDGAATGAAVESSPAGGLAVTDQLVNSTVGGLVTSYSSSVSSNGADITITVRANATKVFPLFPTITLTASSSATIEQFRSQSP